jgi:hypothetical protein
MNRGYDGKTSPLQASVSDRLNFHHRMNFPTGRTDRKIDGTSFRSRFRNSLFLGARTTVDEVESNVEEQGIRFGATLVLPLNRYQSVKLYSISGYNAHREHDFQAFGIASQYRWGGGF